MDIYTIAAAVLCAAALSTVLKGYKPEYSLAISIAVSVGVFAVVLPAFASILAFLQQLAGTHVDMHNIEPVIKALGIALVAQLAGDICRDAGETALASKVELAGKAAILLVAMPLAQELLKLVMGLLQS